MKRSIIATLTLLSCTLHATESTLQMRHRESGGVGYSQGYTSVDYFLTTQGDKTEFLFNLRGHLFNDAHFAGNTGLGVRYSLKDDHYRIGTNVFYDCRDTSHFFANQIGAGLELLSRHFDLRFNGYLPVGKKKNFEERTFRDFVGNNALIRSKLHAALPCIDGEIGVPFCKRWTIAAGSYYLFSEKSHHLTTGNAWGGKLRADVTLGRYVGLGAIVTHDSIFHTRFQGVLSINIPLASRPVSKNQKTKEQPTRNLRQVPIMRNEIIPIEVRRNSREILTTSSDPANPVRFLFVNNTASSGDGSFEKPFASLKEAEIHSEPGDVIYVFPGDGTPRLMDEGIVLKENQILASSGAPLSVNKVEIPAFTPGISPIITNVQPNQPIITNPGKSRLNDFIFLPPWEYLLKGLNALRSKPDFSATHEEPKEVPPQDEISESPP